MSMTDIMFYHACLEVAKYSRCNSRQIGTVLVKDGIIVAMGYNGPPGCIDSCHRGWYKEMIGRVENVCPRQHMGYKSGEGLEYCIAVHAERSAILHAARKGISTAGTTLYMTCSVPCGPCLVEIMEAGVSELVVTDKNKFYDMQSEYLADKCGLKIREWELDS